MLIHGQGCGLNMIKLPSLESFCHAPTHQLELLHQATELSKSWSDQNLSYQRKKAPGTGVVEVSEASFRYSTWLGKKTWNNWRTSGSEKGVFWESHVDEVMMKHYHTVGILWTAQCPRPIAFSTDVGTRVPLVPSSFVEDSLICKTIKKELFLQFKFHYC